MGSPVDPRDESLLLTALMETTQDGLAIVSGTGVLLRCNRRFLQLWGLDTSTDRPDSPATFQCIADQLEADSEWLGRLKGETELPHPDRLHSICLPDGRIFETRRSSVTLPRSEATSIWSFRDVTEHHEAELALRESEQLLAAHFSRTPLASMAWDTEFCVLDWNPAAEKLFGYSREEVLGRSVLELIVPPDRVESRRNEYRALLAGEEPAAGVSQNLTRDGRTLQCEWHSTRLKDSNGEVLGIASFAQDITARVQAQDALRTSEERYRELCNALPQTIFEIDPEGKVIFVNQSAIDMFGYSLAEIEAGMLGFDILQPEDRSRAADNVRRTLTGEKLPGIEYTGVRKDGSTVPLLITGSPIRKRGRILGMRGVVTDLTTQKEAESALEYRLRFERLVSNLSANFINLPAARIEEELGRALEAVGEWLEADRSYVAFHDEARRHFVVRHEFLRNGAVSATEVDTNLRTRHFHALQERLSWGAPILLDSLEEIPEDWIEEKEFLDRLGVRSTAILPLLSGGILYGFVAFDLMRDSRNWSEDWGLQLRLLGEVFSSALDRKRAEEALIRSETKYRSLLESSGLAISFIDTEGRYSIVNHTAASYIGLPADKIVGKHIKEIYRGPRALDYMKRFERVLDTGASQTSEDELELADGLHSFWTIIHPVFEPGGALLGIQIVSHDITDRKQAEEELLELEGQLVQSQKMEAIGNLAGGIAHDFNNLLTGVMGYANILRLRAHSPEDVLEAVSIIEKTAEQASQLTKQLLGFARKGKLQEIQVDVHATIEEVLDLLSRTFDKRVSIGKQFKAQPSTVRADPTQLQQVILNLAVNARDAMPGGGRLTILTGNLEIHQESSWKTADLSPGNYVLISVSDTGDGIPAEIRDRVFEPFFTTKATGMGSGMGLATVYGIVKNHGGIIRLTSEMGRGTTFKVFLPLSTEAPDKTLASVEVDTPVRGEGHVLIVEDESVVRDLARTMLCELGYKVTCVSNGKEAVDLYSRSPLRFDLVLLDMIMPVMGGRDCFREMKTLNPEVVAVLTTGFSDEQEVHHVMKEGMAGFIQKPYRLEDLSRVIRNALKANKPA